MENIFKNKLLLLINVLILIYIINITNCFQFSPNMINLINEYININDNETDNDTNAKDLEILYGNITNGIVKFINENIIGNISDNFTKTECYLNLKNISDNETQTKIKSMIQYSNFQISRDISHEIECKTNNLNYTLISYRLKNTSNIPEKNKALLKFLNYRIYFSIGLCLTNECLKILEDNFDIDNKTNELLLKNGSKFYNYINNKVNVEHFTLFKNKDNTKKSEKKIGFIAIFITLLLIILIRIFISIYTNIKLIYVNKKNSSSQSNTLSSTSSFSNKSQNSSGSEDLFLYNQKYQDKANEIKEDSLLEEKYIHFLDFISIFKNLSALGEVQNYMYNDINLEIPRAFQAISLFFFALVSTFNNFIYYPSSDYFNNEIFIGFGISLVKFAQYSSYFYLSLNAFIYSFKFISYYKKYIHNQLIKNYSLVFIYLLTFIPKIIMFIITSYVFHLYSIDIIDKISNYLHQDEYKIRLEPRECINNIYKYLFFFSSYTKDDRMEGFIYCYNYVYSFVNEFYSVIFIIIIFCISIKVRSIILDIIIILLIVINLILNFLFFDNRSKYKANESKYDFTFFLGEKLSIKYFHIYLNIFFYGVFAGIIHFYNIDIISTDRISSNKYFPFCFLDNISNFLSNLSGFKRSLFIILDISLLIALSSVYMIENILNNNSLIFNLNYWLSLLHIYENHIATILFMILVLLFCTMDSDSAAKQLFKSWLFIFISRIGYFFYSICETTIIIFLIVTNYQTHLNISDLLFLNFGQFICGIIISTIFVIIVEIPMRYFIKKLRKKIENKIFNKQNINKEPLINNNQKINLELISFNESKNNIENNNILNNE